MKTYQKVEVFDERSHYPFIDKLFRGLGKYYDDYIQVTYDVPYSYSERTFVGHLAQSAGRSGYYSIQDYYVTARGVKKSLKSHYVPDLHIWIPGDNDNPDTCVFEVKTSNAIPLDKDPEEYSEIVEYQLDKANDQIDRHGLIEAKYRCALIATPIHCASTKWLKYAKTPRTYHKIANKVRADLIDSGRDSGANFSWTYMLDYEHVKDLTWKSKGKKYLPWVGIVCMGTVQRYRPK